MQMLKQDLVLGRYHIPVRKVYGHIPLQQGVAEQELILVDTKFVIPKKFMGISPKQLTINRKDKKMSEENKKEVEKPEEITEEKHDANAEWNGVCGRVGSISCGANHSSSNPSGCGRIGCISCGNNTSWSDRR